MWNLDREIASKRWFQIENEMFTNAQIKPKDNNWNFEGLKIVQRQYNTHFFHHYTAKFIPQIPQNVIKQFRKGSDIIFDPFLGCGTTIVEGKLLGHPSYGIEINPLGWKISKAKVIPIDFNKFDKFMKWLSEKRRYGDKKKEDVTLFKGSNEWFRKDVSSAIYNIMEQITDFDTNTKNFIEIGLSDHLKGASNAMMHKTIPTLPEKSTYVDKKHYNRVVDNKTRKINMYGRVYNQLKRMRFALEYFLLKNSDVPAVPILGDSRKMCDLLSQHGINEVNITVTSPPYWNAQNYQKLHWLSFQLFKLKEPKFGEIGRNKQEYLKDMNKIIEQLSQISKGHFAFVIGEDKNGGNLHKKLHEMTVSNGFEPARTIKRKLSNQVGFTKSIPNEFVYIFKKD